MSISAVAEGLRRHLRSYDLLVRLGGDEFLCVMANITLADAHRRFDDLGAELEDSAGRSASVGFSELLDGDTPQRFVQRADSDLQKRRAT